MGIKHTTRTAEGLPKSTNPWAEGINPAELEFIRKRSFVIASTLHSCIRDQVKKLGIETDEDAPALWYETFFIAGCRTWITTLGSMEQLKKPQLSVWLENYQAVQQFMSDEAEVVNV